MTFPLIITIANVVLICSNFWLLYRIKKQQEQLAAQRHEYLDLMMGKPK